MKQLIKICSLISAIVLILLFSSCSSKSGFVARKYTPGFYREVTALNKEHIYTEKKNKQNFFSEKTCLADRQVSSVMKKKWLTDRYQIDFCNEEFIQSKELSNNNTSIKDIKEVSLSEFPALTIPMHVNYLVTDTVVPEYRKRHKRTEGLGMFSFVMGLFNFPIELTVSSLLNLSNFITLGVALALVTFTLMLAHGSHKKQKADPEKYEGKGWRIAAVVLAIMFLLLNVYGFLIFYL